MVTSHVSFDTITQQIEYKLLKRGFQLNATFVGEFDVVSHCYLF